MRIKYINVLNNSINGKITPQEGSIIEATVYNTFKDHISKAQSLAILFEQAMLTDYILCAIPADDKFIKYRDTIKRTYHKTHFYDLCIEKEREKIKHEFRVTDKDIENIHTYIEDKKITSPMEFKRCMEHISYLSNGKYLYLNKQFYVPYFCQNQSTESVFNTDVILNPVFLHPYYKVSKTNSEDLIVTMIPTSFTSKENRLNKDNPFKNNQLYSYIADLNFNGKNWQNIIDMIQSFSYEKGTTESFTNLSGLLKNYLYGANIPKSINIKDKKKTFITLFNHILKHNQLTNGNDIKIEELVNLMESTFDDNRFKCLLDINNNTTKDSDLRYFIKYGIEQSNETTDDAQDRDSGDQEDTTQDTNEDTEDTNDEDQTTNDDNEGDEGETDDLGGDDFATDDTDTSDTSSNTEIDAQDEEAKPEDVNPLIEIIDGESFDDFLTRGLIEKKLLSIFKNPPTTMSVEQLNFLKYWYIQWFPLVSIATTKTILGDLLKGNY